MTGSEKRDGSAPPPTGGDARSPSPGDKSTVTEEPVPDQDVTADTSFTDNHQLYQPMCTDGAADDPAEDTNSNATGSNGHAKSDSVYPTPSSMAAYTSSASTRRSSKVESMTEGDTRPSFDDQVAKLNLSIAQPLVDKQKGYVVSMNWLSTVFSRSSVHADKVDKSAAEGKIGPVNSVDIVLDTEPSAVFKDEADEPFVPLRPNLRKGADFEIVPQEGWDLMMKWYGLADESPAIVRYAHNTTSNEGDESVQYEINPPIFTVVKLANPSALTTPQSLKEKIALPVKFMATRATNVQQWLTQAKQLANIDMSVKVRIWTIRNSMETTSTALTPASSRTPSPAPSLPSNAKLASNLVLDLNMFLSVPEGQRQLLTDIKDQTTNPNYNGSMTLGLIGLGENEEILVLEEYIAARGGGDWISEAPKQTLERLGVPAGTAVTAPAPKPKKIAPTNVKSAPAQRPTRGRAKISKPRGCIGLKNLSNTCYMNSALQCMRNVEELSHYFLCSYFPDLPSA